jgi:hypothetical protein
MAYQGTMYGVSWVESVWAFLATWFARSDHICTDPSRDFGPWVKARAVPFWVMRSAGAVRDKSQMSVGFRME